MTFEKSERVSEPIVVKVNADQAEMIPSYLERRRHDLASLSLALERGDFETIRLLGHQMKGSGAGYGLEAITEIGGALESAARARDAWVISASMRSLEDYLARVQAVLA